MDLMAYLQMLYLLDIFHKNFLLKNLYKSKKFTRAGAPYRLGLLRYEFGKYIWIRHAGSNLKCGYLSISLPFIICSAASS